MNNVIIYTVSTIIAISIVLITLSGLAELSKHMKTGIETIVCSQYGGCDE